MSFCSICTQEKSPSEFNNDFRRMGGLRSWCKVCSAARQKVWDAARYQRLLKENPELLRMRDTLSRRQTTEKHARLGDTMIVYFAHSLKSRHGLTLGDYFFLWDRQKGKCALCGCDASESHKGLHVDHDHSCFHDGHPKSSCKACIRGLLCHNCNRQHLPWAEKDVALQGPAVVAYLLRRPFQMAHEAKANEIADALIGGK